MPLYQLSGIGTQVIKSSVAKATPVTVGIAAVQIALPDTNRLGLTIQNTSDRTMYIGFDNTVTLTSYAIAIEKGLAYEFPVAYQGALFAICTNASKTVTVIEFS